MPKKDNQPHTSSIDIDTGRLNMSFKTLLAIITISITIVTGLTTMGANMVTKADVNKALLEHSKYPHTKNGNPISAPASLSKKVENCESNINNIKRQIENIPHNIKQLSERQRYIEAKIDFMIERELEKAKTNPLDKSANNKAAKKIRKRAKKLNINDDPLKSIDGL